MHGLEKPTKRKSGLPLTHAFASISGPVVLYLVQFFFLNSATSSSLLPDVANLDPVINVSKESIRQFEFTTHL